MITYDKLIGKPSAFRSLTGLDPAAFDGLYREFVPQHAQRLQAASLTKRTHQPRRRAVGAGRRYRHDLRDRLLMALFWLRVYPTYEVLGFFFSLDKTNAEANSKEVLATLAAMSTFAFEDPRSQRVKLRSPEAVMDAFPDVWVVIDAKEQRIQRPHSTKDNDRQRPYYSGKKKAHTLKTQVGVQPDGRLGAISDSVPGAIHDLTLLRQSHWLDDLDALGGGMLDKGYEGIPKDYPHARLYLPHKARRQHPLTDEQKAYNRHLAAYRIVVEHTLAQMNQFQVLAQVFRHALSWHSQVVRAVAGLVDRRLAVTPLKAGPQVA